MIGLLSSAFVASLVGSLHCAGMCGGLVAAGAARSPSAYHGGRFLAYVSLGAAAGAVGAAVNLAGAAAGWTQAAVAIAAAGMVLWGGVLLGRSFGLPIPYLPRPTWLFGLQRGLVGAGVRPCCQPETPANPPKTPAVSRWRPFLLGLVTAALPCGWLYAFVVSAAGTGSPLTGGLVMAAFWAGTLPILLGVGVSVRWALGRRFQRAIALLIVVAGLWTLYRRAHVSAPGLLVESAVSEGESCCHGGR